MQASKNSYRQKKVINEINKIRKKYFNSFKTKSVRLDEIHESIEDTEHLSAMKITMTVENCIKGKYFNDVNLNQVIQYIDKNDSGLIFSLFDASYFPQLTIDGFFYRTLPVDSKIKEKFVTRATPVEILHASEGFLSKPVVALFPENHLNSKQGSSNKIFYFINKFVARFYRITKKLMDNYCCSDFFSDIANISPAEIEEFATIWVCLHEHFHSQGQMPIPEYLHLKKSKPLAGLEELRVDINSMLVCINDKHFDCDKYRKVFLFILAERLLRYSIEGVNRPNYDAIASQMMFSYLNKCRAIAIINNKIEFNENLVNALSEILSEINHIESHIKHHPGLYVVEKLRSFINNHTHYDHGSQSYKHLDFFARVKQDLNL